MRRNPNPDPDTDLSGLSDARIDDLATGAAARMMELERGDVFANTDGTVPRRVVGLRGGDVQTVDPLVPAESHQVTGSDVRQSYNVLEVYTWWLQGRIVPARLFATVVPEDAVPEDAEGHGYVAVPRRTLATLADVVNDWLAGYDPEDRDAAAVDAVETAYDVLGHDPAEQADAGDPTPDAEVSR